MPCPWPQQQPGGARWRVAAEQSEKQSDAKQSVSDAEEGLLLLLVASLQNLGGQPLVRGHTTIFTRKKSDRKSMLAELYVYGLILKAEAQVTQVQFESLLRCSKLYGGKFRIPEISQVINQSEVFILFFAIFSDHRTWGFIHADLEKRLCRSNLGESGPSADCAEPWKRGRCQAGGTPGQRPSPQLSAELLHSATNTEVKPPISPLGQA